MKTTLTIIGTMLAVGFAGLCGETAEAAKRQGGGYPALVAASEIKGTKVHNLQNQEIGYVDEVLIEPSAGQVRFVVLNVGGFLGIGGTKVAVPWTAFQLSREGNKPKWVLDADKERLKNAPKVEGTHYERLYTRTDAEPVFLYWHIEWFEPDTGSSPSALPSASPLATP
jgi:sporulation protein YlmC with PRC-barrel domain